MTARTALVTGGSQGIGRAVVARLADDGHRVIALARRSSLLDGLAREFDTQGARIETASCDVTDAASVRSVMRSLGSVDILVHAAGSASSAPFLRTEPAEVRRLFEVNVLAALVVTQHLLDGMRAKGWGRVVFIGSVSGLVGLPYTTAYAASKHALVGLMRVLAAESGSSGVTANAVCPTYVRTQMTKRTVRRIVETTELTQDQALAQLTSSSRLGRLLEPEEVAGLVSWLVSEGARAVNGQVHVMDGGDVQH